MGSLPIGISASRSSTIMGLNPWSSEFEVWQKIIEERYPGINKKLGYDMPLFEETAQIRWGNAFEDAVCKLAEEKESSRIIEREALCVYDNHNSYITCHIDGRYEGSPSLHEGKTTSIFYFNDNFGEPGTDKIPTQYQSQCQHQMLCTGAEKVILSVLVFPRRVDEWESDGWSCKLSSIQQENSNSYDMERNNPDGKTNHDGSIKIETVSCYEWANTLNQMGYFHTYEIPANKETQKAMLSYYKKWWNDHIVGRQPPEPAYYKDIKRIFKSPKGTIIADMQLERWTKEYKECGEELGKKGALSKRREQLKVLILKEMMKLDGDLDDDSREKTILRSKTGGKLMSYDGRTFR